MNQIENLVKKWDIVIGLEVHVQLMTKTKMFTPLEWSYGESPNTQICPITLGYPGTLPTINIEAVKKGILIGLALNCSINRITKFARKHYFYPDLPKGYQISQFKEPLCENGYLEIFGDKTKKIRILRAHLEEDAGKTIHSTDGEALIDYNRAGAPLLEIVSHPDIFSAEEASLYLHSLKEIIRSVNGSDCNMEKGNLRVDLNLSLKKKGSSKLGTRREVKNINSFRNVEKAINYECTFQAEILENNQNIRQETLLWDDRQMITKSIRDKEDAHDYRYFPEPDLPPLKISATLINELEDSLPELPNIKRKRLSKLYSLSSDQVNYLTSNDNILKYFELLCVDKDNSTKYYNWLSIEIATYLKDNKLTIDKFPISYLEMKKLIESEIKQKIDHSKARLIFKLMLEKELTFNDSYLLLKNEKSSIGDIEKFVDEVLSIFPDEKNRLTSGETKLINFFVGQIIKKSKGKFSQSDIKTILNNKFSTDDA